MNNPSDINVTASACGKAILVGEHAVVYGAQAVAIPLASIRVELTLQQQNSNGIQVFLGSEKVSKELVTVVLDTKKFFQSRR